MKRNNKKGFTIVELVIVIAVIAILAGVLIPTFAGITSKAKESKALQEVKNAYTVYMSEALANKETPVDTLYVAFDGFSIQISNGVAEITDGTTEGDEYQIVDTEDGKDKTLALVVDETPEEVTPDEQG